MIERNGLIMNLTTKLQRLYGSYGKEINKMLEEE